MSDVIKLKDAVAEYRKANKSLDDKLTEVEESHLHRRKEQEGQQNHRD